MTQCVPKPYGGEQLQERYAELHLLLCFELLFDVLLLSFLEDMLHGKQVKQLCEVALLL